MNWNLLFQLVVNGMIVGALYGVVAMTFVLIYKATQVVNFAQGEFLLVGAWVCWWLLTTTRSPSLGLPVHAGLHDDVRRHSAGRRAAAADRGADDFRHHGDDRAVIFFQALMKWIFGVFAKPFPPIFETQSVSLFGLEVQTVYLLSLGISLLIMAGFAWFFKDSKMGLAMRATAFDQQVAQSLGISVRKVFAMSWAISAVVSAVAGVVVGMVNGVSSALSFYGIKVFPAVILGGLDSIVGAVLGGLIVGVLENVAQYFDSQLLNWGNMYEIAPFYALILILLIKPYGLFGTKNIERV